MHKRYIAQRIQYNILIKVMNIYISSATEIDIPPKAEFCSEIYYSTFYIVVILLKRKRQLRGRSVESQNR